MQLCTRLSAIIVALALSGCTGVTMRVRGEVHLAQTQTQSDQAPVRVENVRALGNGIALTIVSPERDAELLWDRSSFAAAGKSYRIVSGDTRVINTGLAQGSLMIQAGTSADVFAVPLDAPQSAGTLKLRFLVDGKEEVVSASPTVIAYDRVKRVGVGGGHIALCWLTGAFYGGWCWAYLSFPSKSQKEDALGAAREEIERMFGPAQAELTATRIGW